jgi:integrase
MDPATKVDTLRERIGAGERGGSAADREALLAFEDQLAILPSEYSAHRREKLLRHCTRLSEHVDADLVDVPHSEDAAKPFVRWIHREYDNPETNQDYRLALRAFGKHVTDGDELPDGVDWIPASTPSSYDPAPDPADMMRWDEDIKPMIDAAANPRDAALVALAFDAGCRSGELQDLTVGDLSDADYGLRLRVDGRRGQRSVTLVPSEP